MIVYWGSCFISMAAAYLGMTKLRDKNSQRIAILLSSLPMILVAALRYDVGQDYSYTYLPYFNMVQNHILPEDQKMEPLYHGLNELIVGLHGDSVWVFAVCAVVFYVLIYDQIAYDSPDPVMSIFLLTGMGYVFVFFNIIRQMVGCAILLFSVRYIHRRSIIPFLVCVAVAAGFHTACVLFVICYFLPFIRIRPRMAVLLTAVFILSVTVIIPLVLDLVKVTPYAIYLSSVFDTGETAFVTIAINLSLMAFLCFGYRESKTYQLYFNMQLISLWIAILSGNVVLALRIMWIFSLSAVISVPMAAEKVTEDRNRMLVKAGIFLLYFFYVLYTVGLKNSNNVMPYKSVIGRWL